MSVGPEPRPGILSIKPYVGGKGGTVSGPVYKLSSNESALGPSPHAREAYRGAGERLSIYPDGAQQDLKAAIAERYGLELNRIICGAGSDEILSHLGHAYLRPGDEVLYSAHGFVLYPLIALASGATPVAAPETALTADVDALLAAVTERTRIVFLANPNNPTGTYVPVDELRRLHTGLPSQVLLVVDAAYAEFVQANDYEAGIELVATCDNVVMTRTFSKIHALAALRLGWAYCPLQVAEVVNRIRGPFNVASPALAAGAASMRDSAHSAKAISHNDTWRTRLAAELSNLGLEVTPSVANFLLLGFPELPDKSADRAEAFLAERGIYLRNVADYGLPNCLRITVGSVEANEAAVKALGEFLGLA